MINDIQLLQLRIEALRLANGDITLAQNMMNYIVGDLISAQLAQAKTAGMEQVTGTTTPGPSVISAA